MKRGLLTLFFISIITSLSFAQDCNIGNEDSTQFNYVPPIGVTLFAGNYLLGVKFTLNTIGTLHSLNLLGRNTGAQVQMAVYEDDNGTPGNLLVSSGSTIVSSGIISLPVSPTQLTSGDYWIMAVYDSGGSHTYYNDSAIGNVLYYKSLNFGDSIPNNASNFLSYIDSDITYFMGITCGVLGISDYRIVDRFNIFPNPTTDFLNISGDNIESIKVFDMNGKLVLSEAYNMPDVKIDVTGLSNGFYTVLVNNNQRMKLIKN